MGREDSKKYVGRHCREQVKGLPDAGSDCLNVLLCCQRFWPSLANARQDEVSAGLDSAWAGDSVAGAEVWSALMQYQRGILSDAASTNFTGQDWWDLRKAAGLSIAHLGIAFWDPETFDDPQTDLPTHHMFYMPYISAMMSGRCNTGFAQAAPEQRLRRRRGWIGELDRRAAAIQGSGRRRVASGSGRLTSAIRSLWL